jgi:putative membrane protein
LHSIVSSPTAAANQIRPVVTGLFLASWIVVVLKVALGIPALEATGWPEAALVLTGSAATMVGLAWQLPVQNVLLASFIIAAIGGTVDGINAFMGTAYGFFVYTETAGARLFGILPWPMPLIWIVFILSSRGVSHLILRSCRQTPHYGFRVIGFTILLSLLLDFGLEIFGLRIERLWIREPMRLGVECYGTPLSNYVGWMITSLLILVFATPSMIRKKPVQAPPDFQPLVVWLALNVLFATAAAAHQLWTVAAVMAGIVGVTTVFAIRGAKS